MAAFLVSLMKVSLIFQHKTIPPNANLNSRNPKIKWDEYKLNAPTVPTPLPARAESGRSIICMSGSGIGGSNGHVVLEAPPALPSVDVELPVAAPILFLVGGLSPRSTTELAESLVAMLLKDSSPAALSQAVTHSRRARQCPWRSSFIFTPGSTTPPKIQHPVLVPKATSPLVFLFAGQGAQHMLMGRSLFRDHPVYRNCVLELDALHTSVTGHSLLETTGLFRGTDVSKLGENWSTDIIIPSMAMCQLALYELLKSVGIQPDVRFNFSGFNFGLTFLFPRSSSATVLERLRSSTPRELVLATWRSRFPSPVLRR